MGIEEALLEESPEFDQKGNTILVLKQNVLLESCDHVDCSEAKTSPKTEADNELFRGIVRNKELD